MDWSVIWQSLPLYGQAALLTLWISVAGITLALAIGVLTAVSQQLRIPVVRQIAVAYVELSRNTPLLVQLFFLYYGLPKLGITWSAQTCAIVGLAFLGGSYMSEAFRSGFNVIAPIQYDSAAALGLGRVQTIRAVTLPQALAYAFPALTANVIFLVKETSVVSVIALADLVYTAKEQIGNTYNTQEALFLLVLFYLVILVPLALYLRHLEGKVRHGSMGV